MKEEEEEKKHLSNKSMSRACVFSFSNKKNRIKWKENKYKTLAWVRVPREWFKWLHWVRACVHASIPRCGHSRSIARSHKKVLCVWLNMQTSYACQTYSTSWWVAMWLLWELNAHVRLKNGPFPKSISIFFFFLIFYCFAATLSIDTSSTPLRVHTHTQINAQRNACLPENSEKWIFFFPLATTTTDTT